jgi:hypothetical protein
MASKLQLYNLANLALGERKLASLSENRPSRRRLDSVWDAGGVRKCLAAGLWNHAMDVQAITYSPSVDPTPHWQRAFDKPAGWVRTALCSDDAQFRNLRFQYDDLSTYLLANCDTIYLKFVSSSATFGGDLSLWPENFLYYAAHEFASLVCISTTNSQGDKEAIDKEKKRLLNIARGTDAMDESAKQLPPGTWSTSRRFGTSGGGRDGGNTGSLIG